jgi:Cu2+-exporting ATPase
VNVATSRVSVDWNPGRIELARILEAVAAAGFKPVPLAGAKADSAFRQERRAALKRIGLAGLGMMQVMMYVFGIYVAEPDAIDPAIASYLRYVGLLITTPVLLYSGAPFFIGAWQNIQRRALGMDVPVALALALAYVASVFNTVRGVGQTYFDSVTMFIFFLSAGRYVEMVVRQRSLSLSEAVGRSLPAQASRVKVDGTVERIPIGSIETGDLLSVPRGGVMPVDAELAAGTALVDESLVTGESKPERKVAGAALLGGSVNTGAPIRVIARSTVSGSTLASIVALLERAQSTRPAVASAADRIAGVFVIGILALAAIVAVAWLIVDPARAFPASLAVLVVTCPCALSLATPVAVAAASTRLARSGLLITRADALERLANVDAVVLDKTGTLTSGQLSIVRVTTLVGDAGAALATAAALERESSHPIASAFAPHASATCFASNVSEVEGRGVEGEIEGERWRLGRYDYVAELAPAGQDPRAEDALCLGNADGLVALFEPGEEIRADASQAVSTLRRLHVEPVIASGDRAEAVARVAATLDIQSAHARLVPSGKVDLVRALQSQGRRVLAIGDGINDGPVLAASAVSCAMGQGSAIAQAAADLLLLNDALSAVADGIATARRMLAVIRQNLRWSFVYNVAAVPLAALDLVPPWVAAVGMSASSLLVVLNARRLATGSLFR